eukprot:g3082.t1
MVRDNEIQISKKRKRRSTAKGPMETPSRVNRGPKMKVVPMTAPPALRDANDNDARVAFMNPSRIDADIYGTSLFVGSYTHSRARKTLERLGIGAILCVKEKCRFQEGYKLYEHIPLSDLGRTDLIGGQDEEEEGVEERESNVLTPTRGTEGPPALYRCAAFVSRCAGQGLNVLIHCSSGVNRSPTVAIGILMLLKHWTLKQSFECVRRGRPCISPHERYFKKLQTLDKRLHGGELSLTRDDVGPSLQQTVRDMLREEDKENRSSPSVAENTALAKLKSDLAQKDLELQRLKEELVSSSVHPNDAPLDSDAATSKTIEVGLPLSLGSDLSGDDDNFAEKKNSVSSSFETPEKRNVISDDTFLTPPPPPTPANVVDASAESYRAKSNYHVDHSPVTKGDGPPKQQNDTGTAASRSLHRASTKGFEGIKDESACRCVIM